MLFVLRPQKQKAEDCQMLVIAQNVDKKNTFSFRSNAHGIVQ